MSKSSWLRNGYSKVARVLGKGDPKKQDLPTLELEDHPEGQHAQETVETYGTLTNNIKRLIKEFRIYRWSPDNPYRKPYLHSYWPIQMQPFIFSNTIIKLINTNKNINFFCLINIFYEFFFSLLNFTCNYIKTRFFFFHVFFLVYLLFYFIFNYFCS